MLPHSFGGKPCSGRIVAALVADVGCLTRPNPDYCDETRLCTNPDRPFCDLTGEYSGTRNLCIPEPPLPDAAIDVPDAGPPCDAPGAFLRCDGDTKVVCSMNGNEQEEVCEFGCVEADARCNECSPGATACITDEFTRCDADGLLLERTDCPLGCHGAEARCNRLAPSNGLTSYLDLAADADDVVLSDGAQIDTDTGNVLNGDATPVLLPSSAIPAPVDGVPVRVFILRSLVMGDVSVSGSAAFAIVAEGPITIDGSLVLQRTSKSPGQVTTGGCVGEPGGENLVAGAIRYSGAGGGGGSTAGGDGGGIEFAIAGGTGGIAFPNPDVIPLRGGCRAAAGGLGGGAVQLVSSSSIELSDDASIAANGGGGLQTNAGGDGGGAGGAILLEAPVIMLGNRAILAANGGGGSCALDNGSAGLVGADPAPGGSCSSLFNMTDGGALEARWTSGPSRPPVL